MVVSKGFSALIANFGYLALAIAFCLNVSRCAPEFDLPLVGPYAYRQSQTAIGIRQYEEEGLSILHEIPTFGEPWVLPMEFPLYQWISAEIGRASGWSTERAGRTCSLMFFYATIPLLVCLITLLDRTPQQAACIAAVILVSPTYQFWGRTVLIESTALFFSMGYLVGAISWVGGKGNRWIRGAYLACTLACGMLAALVKITTFAVAFGFLALYLVGKLCQREIDWRKGRIEVFGLAVVTALSILVGKAWIDYADGIKATGLVTQQLTSSGLRDWNYGTLALRLSKEYWGHMWEYGVQEALPAFHFLQWGPDRWVRPLHLVSIAAIVTCVIWFASRRWNNLPIFLAFLLAFISGPLVFSNLYYEHQYYWYANLWLLIAGILYVIWDPEIWSRSVKAIRSGSQGIGLIERLATAMMLAISIGFGIMTVGAWKYHEYADWQAWSELRQEDKEAYLAMRTFATLLPHNEDDKGVYLYAGVSPTTEVPYFLRRRTLFISLTPPQPEATNPVIEEAISLQRKGYRLEGLVELFPKEFSDVAVRESVLGMLSLKVSEVSVDGESCRCTLLKPVSSAR